jgi:Na+/proline symporter
MKINPFVALLTLGSLLGLFLLYGELPEQIPMRWGLEGQVEYYGPKAWLWLLASLGLLIHLLMILLHKIDPKKANIQKHAKVFNLLNFVVPLFLLSLFWFTVFMDPGGSPINNPFCKNRGRLADHDHGELHGKGPADLDFWYKNPLDLIR